MTTNRALRHRPALFLNRRGDWLSARNAQPRWAARSSGPAPTWSWSTELIGHARLETARADARPAAEDRTKALEVLSVDR
jgi:hypothetical protein